MATKNLFKIKAPDGGEAFKVEDVDGTASIYVDGEQVSATAAEINKLDGVSATAAEMDHRAITVEIEDISSSGQSYIVSPYTGNVSAVYSVINGAITGADATLTVKDADGNSMGTITVANSSSAAGDVDSLTPASNEDVAAGDAIEIETDGASTNAVKAFITILIDIT